MQTIKFSHKYAKMPDDISNTKLLEVFKTNYKDLSSSFRVYDTEYNYGYYDLQKTDLIVLFLVSYQQNMSGGYNEHPWTTIRRWTPEKEVYYRSLRGQDVKIVIA